MRKISSFVDRMLSKQLATQLLLKEKEMKCQDPLITTNFALRYNFCFFSKDARESRIIYD